MTKETLDGIQKNINSSLAKTKKRLNQMVVNDPDDKGKPVIKAFDYDLDPSGHKTICEKVKVNFTPGVGSKAIDLQKAIGKMVGKSNKTAIKIDGLTK